MLAVAQMLVGLGIGISYSAAIAATAEWSTDADRSRVLALALLGPPLAWIVGMPLVGVVGEVSWRLAWLVVPLAMAIVAIALLRTAAPRHRRLATAPAFDPCSPTLASRAGRWASCSRSRAGPARSSTSVRSSSSRTTSRSRRPGSRSDSVLSSTCPGTSCSVAGSTHTAGCCSSPSRSRPPSPSRCSASLRSSVWFSVALFATLCFIAGGRTLAGSARGLGLAPELRLGVTGVRTAAIQSGYFVGAAVGGVALAVGGYSALGLAFAALFVGAAIPHLVPLR